VRRAPAALVAVALLTPALSPGARAEEDSAPAAERLTATEAGDLRPAIAVLEDRVLILAPGGLYRLHLESESSTLTTEREGLPEAPLVGLCPTAEDLWIAGAGGASFSDLRFDDWQRYGPSEGLPGRAVTDVEEDEDYAYAATDSGAARFDRYVLEWEVLAGPNGRPLGPCADVALSDERVWFALTHGVAEFRKGPESMHLLEQLGQLEAPAVLALRQTPRHLWAITPAGLARYDKSLETWTSYAAGTDFPDARIHQATLQGDDLWLATDAGLWRYLAASGIWRQHEAADQMPGTRVTSFAIESDRVWVVTERAFAVYETADARWIDFTPSVPLAPGECRQMVLAGTALVLVAKDRIVYGLFQGEQNPSLFAYRTIPIEALAQAEGAESHWSLGLDAGGLTLTAPTGETATVKGGATIYVEEEASSAREEGLGDLAADTRVDASVSGRLRGDRAISGFYNSLDPDNVAYQLSYRGAHEDVLRSASAGEIDQQLFNTQLTPETGLRGVEARGEIGSRSDVTKRRLLTADGWAGQRRTFPGRDVFRGDSRGVNGSLRDRDYTRRMVFALPAAWNAVDPNRLHIYRDDGSAATDDANTVHGILAGREGSWDRLTPVEEYTLGDDGSTLILVAPLGNRESLAATAEGSPDPPEADLTAADLQNHYWLASAPVPGSLDVTIADTTGATRGGDGRTYLQIFGLDRDGNGVLDAERFSPLTGMLAFPDSLPFPSEVYAVGGRSFYTIGFTYRSRLTIFQTSHGNLVPGSEQIMVDRERLQPNTDYTLIPTTGIFVLFEHILLDEDSIIEVSYMYESTGDEEEPPMVAAQFGFAPEDHLFVGTHAVRWEDNSGQEATTADLNTRFEWKNTRSFLRLMPEIGVSRQAASPERAASQDQARAVALQARHRGLEIAGSHRTLGADFVTLEDRQTLLGRLREDSSLSGRWDLGRRLQAKLDWSKIRSDSVASGILTGNDPDAPPPAPGVYSSGEESALLGRLTLLNNGLPNIVLTRGLVSAESPEGRAEKWITRAEIELDPSADRLRPLKLQRLWVRSFFQRSDRQRPTASSPALERRVTDHAYLRINGSCGNPFAWNVVAEDRRTHRPAGSGSEDQDLRLYQHLDTTVQLRPHASFDGYGRWESDRALFWHQQGETQGYTTSRWMQTTLQLYPGRLHALLNPLSLRFDLTDDRDHRGEPGDEQPDAGSLLNDVSSAPEQGWSRSRILETRLQVVSWLRFINRLEGSDQDIHQEALLATTSSRNQENRFELRPRGGLLTLRVRTEAEESGLARSQKMARFQGDWDQTWGRGFLTYGSLELQRTDAGEGLVLKRAETLSPRARVTLRRSFLHLDASLEVAYTLIQTEDRSSPPTGESTDGRSLSLAASCSIQPHQVISLKAQYGFTRSLPEGTGSRDWSNSQDLRLRIAIRL
jgi:hypothetical protein